MRLEVAVVKAGQTLAAEFLVNPGQDDVVAAVTRVYKQAEQTRAGPLWPFQVVVRPAD